MENWVWVVLQFGITSDFIFPYRRRLQKLTTITLTELCSWHYCFFLSLTSKNTKLYLTVSSTEFLLCYFQFPEHYSTRSEKKRLHILLFRTQWWKRVFFILSIVLIFFLLRQLSFRFKCIQTTVVICVESVMSED